MASPGLAFDMDKLNQFMESAIRDLGAAMHASLALIGDRLGLYKQMAGAGELTSAELAERAGVDERYLREWLNANAASGYVKYNAATGTYSMPPEQAMALAVEDSPAFLAGAYQLLYSVFQDVPKIEEAFRTGRGVGWHEHHHDLFCGTERFFRPAYNAYLTSSWLPALEGVVDKLERRRQSGGCGLRPRRINHRNGESVSEIEFCGLRLSSGLNRNGARAGGGSGPRRPRTIRSRSGRELSRQWLRSGGVFRLPSRHGRSGRRGEACL